MKCCTAWLLAAWTTASLAAASDTLNLTQTFSLPGVVGRFDHFALDTAGQRLFVAALGNNSLEVIDLAAGKRVQSVAGMAKPTGVLYLPESNQVLVANGSDGTLKILDGATFKVVKTLSGLEDADNLRFDSAAKLAWLGYADGALGLIDAHVPREIAKVPLPKHPESFQLEQEGRRLFVNVPDARQVAVIDREKRAVIASWPMEKFQANFPMALDEPNHRLFIGCRNPARLVVLDTANGKPVADLAISGDVDDLFYDPARKRLYLSCGEGFLDTVRQASADTYARISQLPTAPGARTCFFSSKRDRLYLAVPDRDGRKAEIRVFQPQE